MQYRNLRILGTSHIAKESINAVENEILEKRPEIVAIELDGKRLYALLHKEKARIQFKDIKRIGFKGWLFSLIGAWAEKKLGEKVGVSPGTEMLNAFQLARQTGARIALIDQDIEITLKRFSKSLSWKEKGNFIVDMLKGLFFRKGVEFDISKVPSHEVIQKLIKKVRKRYPNIYRVLVQERNEVMAKNLAMIMADYPDARLLAVVGAGHEKEIVILVKKYLNIGNPPV